MDTSQIEGFLSAREEDDLAFFAYRLPFEEHVIYSLAEEQSGLQEGGFVVAPFSHPMIHCKTLMPVASSEAATSISPYRGEFPASTTPEKHREGVLAIREDLRRIGKGKCVLSRVITGKTTRSFTSSFFELCKSRPDAFVFLFRISGYDTWIGASPELLLSADGHSINAMALAGTRPVSEHSQNWDQKNIEEQHLVTCYIIRCFKQNGLTPEVGPLHTREAGPVEHLCNKISVPATSLTKDSLQRLLAELSPTPALCGTPRRVAVTLIRENETHDRLLYGGFIGPYKSVDDFEFYVNLRSAMLTSANRNGSKNYCQYVGGGITRFSDPDAEWSETERKASSLLPFITDYSSHT